MESSRCDTNGRRRPQCLAAIWSRFDLVPNRHRCTASLISPYWVVTAAHCGIVLLPGQTQIRVGGLNNNDPTQYQEVGLAAFYPHPDFHPEVNFTNDIALIKFQRPVKDLKHAQPLALSPVSPPVNMTGTIAGWGWIYEDLSNPNCGKTVNVLQELEVKVVPDSVCRVWLEDPATQSCLVAANGSNAMGCYGDSGGPFVRKVANIGVLMGITGGDGVDETCATDSTPTGGTTQGSGVWTDVAPYFQWIITTVISHSDPSQAPVVVN
jgi:secreted trypsin-like serine protease